MCDSFQLHSNESIEVQRGSSELQIEEHPHGMRQHFTDEAVLKVPQLMDADASHRKPFGQVGSHGFHALAQPRTGPEQRRTVGGRHAFARGRQPTAVNIFG